MSTLNEAANADGPVLHNVYFEGKVQSLALETERGRATVGVMKNGTYQFSTSTIEHIVIISGTMNTKLSGEDWKAHQPNESFSVDAGVVFDIICDTDVAYICYYQE